MKPTSRRVTVHSLITGRCLPRDDVRLVVFVARILLVFLITALEDSFENIIARVFAIASWISIKSFRATVASWRGFGVVEVVKNVEALHAMVYPRDLFGSTT